MTLLVDRCLKRSNLVQELIEDWQRTPSDSTIDADLDEIVSECVELCRLLTRAWSIREKQLFSTGAGWLEDLTRVLDAATKKGLDISAKSLALAADREFISSLEKEMNDLREVQKSAVRFDEAKMKAQLAQSRADFLRGEYRYVEDILAEMRASERQHAN